MQHQTPQSVALLHNAQTRREMRTHIYSKPMQMWAKHKNNHVQSAQTCIRRLASPGTPSCQHMTILARRASGRLSREASVLKHKESAPCDKWIRIIRPGIGPSVNVKSDHTIQPSYSLPSNTLCGSVQHVMPVTTLGKTARNALDARKYARRRSCGTPRCRASAKALEATQIGPNKPTLLSYVSRKYKSLGP